MRLAPAVVVALAGWAQCRPLRRARRRPRRHTGLGLGDLMTMTTVQPRHIKLALAGRKGNWAYAKYALHELEEAFRRVIRVVPKYRGSPLGGMIDAIAKGPMVEMTQAIEERTPKTSPPPMPSLPSGAMPAIKPPMSDRS